MVALFDHRIMAPPRHRKAGLIARLPPRPEIWHMETVIALVLAPVTGSFIACAAIRLPAGQGLWGRSACPCCGHVLGAAELVPLASWLMQRGQCRHCGGGIAMFYPIIELLAVLVAGSAIATLDGWRLVTGLALGWTLLLLAAIDWRAQVLPDGLTLPLAAGGVAAAIVFDPERAVLHGIAATAGWTVFLALGIAYRRLRGIDGLGGGDGKLAAAAGAWIGPVGLPWVVLMAALGGLAAIAVTAMAGAGWPADRRLPFGPFLAAAIWGVWLAGQATG